MEYVAKEGTWQGIGDIFYRVIDAFAETSIGGSIKRWIDGERWWTERHFIDLYNVYNGEKEGLGSELSGLGGAIKYDLSVATRRYFN